MAARGAPVAAGLDRGDVSVLRAGALMGLRDRLARALLGDLIDRQISVVRSEADAKIADAESRAAMAQTRVRETLSRDDQKNLEQGFRRLTTSTSSLNLMRDLQPLQQDHHNRLVYWLWESNPLAKWLLETTVDFVLGEGAKVTSDAPEIQETIDTFWDDPVNQLDRRLDSFTREYGMYGELCLPAFVNEVDGHVRLAYVDPFEIDRIITDPENALINTAVVLKARAGGAPPRVLKVIRETTNRAEVKNYGLMMPNLPLERDPVLGVSYDGCCFLFQANKISNGRRGRSDLLPLIDWLDAYDQFLFDSMDTAALWNSFAWDVTLENMNQTQIEEWYQKFAKDIKRNGVFAHNEKVHLVAVTPDLKAPDKDQFARLHRGHILGSMSYPEHWYGLAGEVNFASAKEMGLPPVKRLTRRQKEIRYIISDLVRFQLHQKIRVGELEREVVIGKVNAAGDSKGLRKPTDKAFSIVLPELSMRDQASTVGAVTSLVAALIQARSEGWVRPETAAKVFAAMLSQLGMEIDGADEFTPGVGPMGAAGQDYDPAKMQQMLERLKAQLSRQGNGNGDNINESKAAAVREGVREALRGAEHAREIALAAMNRPQPQPAAQTITVESPAITVEAPVVNVAPAAITVAPPSVTVEAPIVNVAAPTVTVEAAAPAEAPVVNVAPAAITVEAPVVNVAAPAITVEAPAPPPPAAMRDRVTERDDKGRVVTIERTPMEGPSDG